MGNILKCCKGDDDNIDNILDSKDEIYYKPSMDDYLIEEDYNINSSKKEKDSKIEQELPIDFSYNSHLIYGNKMFFTTNYYDDNQQEFLINDISYLEEQTIYDINNLKKEQLNKINKILENYNKNGRPRSTDDFDPKGWTRFYPENDPFFIIQDSKINHNKLKIYNQKDIKNTKIYQGDLNKFGQRHGIGKFITSNCVLIGMWKEDKFCGWGRESRCNGDVFEGRFENGLINGKGIFLNAKKTKYIGDFKNNRRWGKGKLATNKIIYEGDFYNNQIHGNGRIKFIKNGTEYTGTFKEGQIDGYGIFKWENGDKYEGEVKKGKIHGIGKFISNNGETYQAVFHKGFKVEKKIINNSLEIRRKKNNILTNEEINGSNQSSNNNNINNGYKDDEDDIRYFSTYRNFGFGDE